MIKWCTECVNDCSIFHMEIILGPTHFKTVRNQLAKILHINFNITLTREQGWGEYTKPEYKYEYEYFSLSTSTSTSYSKYYMRVHTPNYFSVTYKSNCTGISGPPMSLGQNKQSILKSVSSTCLPVTFDGLDQVRLHEAARAMWIPWYRNWHCCIHCNLLSKLWQNSCHQFGVESVYEPLISYCQLDHQENNCDISAKIQIFSIQNIELNGTHIVQA